MTKELENTRYPQYTQLYKSVVSSPAGSLIVFADDTAVKAIEFSDVQPAEKENSVSKLAAQQLKEYIAGKRTEFSLPLAPDGTDFQQAVWASLRDIKFGETASYLDIAKSIGNVKACRAVGAANGKNPIPIVIPCHRIIGSNGKLTGYAGGLHRKTYLLALESKGDIEDFSLT